MMVRPTAASTLLRLYRKPCFFIKLYRLRGHATESFFAWTMVILLGGDDIGVFTYAASG